MNVHFFLAIFHVLIIAPLLLYIGFHRAATPDWVYMSLLAIGLVVLIYHSIQLFLRLRSSSSYAWVNAIHALLVAPLLIYVGYHKKDTPRAAYELILMLAFSALGYHIFSLVKMQEVHTVESSGASKSH